MLPTTGLDVGSMPWQTHDLDEEPFGEAVLAHHALGPPAPVAREGDTATAPLQVALGLQSVHHLRDRLSTVTEPLHEPRLYDGHALFLESMDRLEVLLERRVEAIGHADGA